MAKLEKGDKAPAFKGVNQNGETIDSENLTGKKVILYFYPKDDTPGCTKEACNLRDNYEVLTEKGFEVIGVSPDGADSHTKFIAKYNLQFNLIADPEKEILNAYEAWGEKNNYGKKYMGVIRKTYVISEDGTIELIIKQVKTDNHADQILSKLGMN